MKAAKEEIRSQGRRARLQGFDIDSQNPYRKGSTVWRWFREGWEEVENDDTAPKPELN